MAESEKRKREKKTDGSYLTRESAARKKPDLDVATVDLSLKRPALELLSTEGGENFYSYLDWLGLAKSPDLIVLSSMHHYYYNTEDLSDIQTVVNLVPLNQVRNIKGFFHSIYHLIPYKCYFVGCFKDQKTQYRNLFISNSSGKNSVSTDRGIASRFPFLNIFYRILDFQTDRFLSGKNITMSLEEIGFKLVDMTELKGITYFCSRKIYQTTQDS